MVKPMNLQTLNILLLNEGLVLLEYQERNNPD